MYNTGALRRSATSLIAIALVVGLAGPSSASPDAVAGGDVTPLLDGVEQLRPPPEGTGDTFSMDVYGEYWHAVAVRSGSADDNVYLYRDAERSSLLARSNMRGSKIDFVAVYSNGVDPVYPVVRRKSGTGTYTVEHHTEQPLDIGDVLDYQITKRDVTSTFNLYASNGETVTVVVDPGNKKLDVSVFLMAASGTNYRPREFALAKATSGGRGDTETLVYNVTSSQRYGVVVLFETGGGNYRISRTTG